jgi:hypothetical protein
VLGKRLLHEAVFGVKVGEGHLGAAEAGGPVGPRESETSVLHDWVPEFSESLDLTHERIFTQRSMSWNSSEAIGS